MSGNPEKGEVTFVVGDVTYTLQYSVDAVCVIEGLLDKSWQQICLLLAGNRINVLRAALWAGLREHHPDLTLKAAGDLIPKIKEGALPLVSKAIRLALPQEGDGGGDSKSGPPKAAA